MPRTLAITHAHDDYLTVPEKPAPLAPDEIEFRKQLAERERAAAAPAAESAPSYAAALELEISKVFEPLLADRLQAQADAQPRLDKAQAAVFASPTAENEAELHKCQLQKLGAAGQVALAQAAVKQARALLPATQKADALRATSGPEQFLVDLQAKMVGVRVHLDAAVAGMKEAFDLNAQHVKICSDALTIGHDVSTKLTDLRNEATLRLPNRFGQAIGHDAVVSASAHAIGDALRTSGIPLNVVFAIESAIRWQG